MIPALEYDSDQNLGRVPYPQDTKAFLYYSISPGKPRIAGELRLKNVKRAFKARGLAFLKGILNV